MAFPQEIAPLGRAQHRRQTGSLRQAARTRQLRQRLRRTVPELPALPVAPLQTAALLRRGVDARTLRVERRYRFPDKPHGRILQQVLPEEMGSRNGLHTLSSPRIRDGTGAHAPRRSPRHRRQTAPVTGTPSPLAGRIQSPPSRRIQINRECKNPSAQVIPGHITILTTKNIRQFRMFFVYLYVQSQIPKPMRN